MGLKKSVRLAPRCTLERRRKSTAGQDAEEDAAQVAVLGLGDDNFVVLPARRELVQTELVASVRSFDLQDQPLCGWVVWVVWFQPSAPARGCRHVQEERGSAFVLFICSGWFVPGERDR